MAIFYVLPSRRSLGQRFAKMIAATIPNVAFSDWNELAENIAALVEGQGDACVVYREDLDDTLSVREALVQHFGAVVEDEIVEVEFGAARFFEASLVS